MTHPTRQEIAFLTSLVAALLFLFGIFCFYGCSHKGAGSLEKGQDFMAVGDWDKSVQYLQQAAKEDPDNPEVKLLLLRCKWEAAKVHMAVGEKLFKNKIYDEALKAFQISLAFNPSNPKVIDWIRKVKAVQKAGNFLIQGERYLNNKDVQQAQNALIQVLQLDPENERAKELLSQIEQSKMSPFENLALNSYDPISLKFKKTPIINVFEMLSRLSGINFIFDKDILDTKVSLFMSNVTFTRFIEMLLQTNNLKASIVDEKTVLVYPDSAIKRKEYQELQIRTFYLAHLEAKKARVVLSKILKNKYISVNEDLNALTVRGTPDLLELAERILQANDLPSSEVLLNVEILEVNRTKEKQLGLELNPTSVGMGIGESSPDIDKESSFAPFASYYALHKFSSKEMLFSVPTATLHLLKQDGDTKTLANPQIRARNNQKATIHIGERVPIRTNRRIDTNGNVTSDFQYQDIGVKLEASPSININDEISLDLTLEVSSLGRNVGTVDEPQYSIKTRKAKSVLTVIDGETVIVGGLINDEDRETAREVPFLGKLPILGRLFGSYGDNTLKTDILMSITPTVIRSQEYPDYSSTHIWSGSENQVSTQRRFHSTTDSKKVRRNQLPGNDQQSKTATDEMSEKELSADQTALLASQPVPVEEAYSEVVSHIKTEGEIKPTEPLPDFIWPAHIPYSIHVNSYPEKELADQRLKELMDLNYTCYLTYAHVPQKGDYYRIFVGGYDNFKIAEDVCEALKKKAEFTADIHVADRKWSMGG